MRTFLNVPYEEHHNARRRGAKWSMAHKRWYVEDLDRLEPFLRWMPDHLKQPTKASIYPTRE